MKIHLVISRPYKSSKEKKGRRIMLVQNNLIRLSGKDRRGCCALNMLSLRWLKIPPGVRRVEPLKVKSNNCYGMQISNNVTPMAVMEVTSESFELLNNRNGYQTSNRSSHAIWAFPYEEVIHSDTPKKKKKKLPFFFGMTSSLTSPSEDFWSVSSNFVSALLGSNPKIINARDFQPTNIKGFISWRCLWEEIGIFCVWTFIVEFCDFFL